MSLPARLGNERLLELLGEQHEYAGLDYKESLNLGDQRHLAEYVKDCGAMSAEGGYIVVGADDRGTVTTGIPPADVRHFDEANLRGRVRRYLPDIEIRAAVHVLERLTGSWCSGLVVSPPCSQFAPGSTTAQVPSYTAALSAVSRRRLRSPSANVG